MSNYSDLSDTELRALCKGLAETAENMLEPSRNLRITLWYVTHHRSTPDDDLLRETDTLLSIVTSFSDTLKELRNRSRGA